MHLDAYVYTKRVISSRRLILVAEDDSNGLAIEVHEVSEKCTLFVGTKSQPVVK